MINNKFSTQNYLDQQQRLPKEGRHILAYHNNDSIVVYQAYRPSIGNFAAQHGYFGGDFKLSRMTWIKTNFLWMMYRSGWGVKEGQEIALAITLKKSFFDKVLAQAIPSSFGESGYKNQEQWKQALDNSEARLQWDPDRNPSGEALTRRALQLGIKGDLAKEYSHDAILEIDDISAYVASQRASALTKKFNKVQMPEEHVYLPNKNIASHLGISL